MNFDLNDPLADILSDDSNDSFFNDDKYKSNTSNKTPTKDISTKKSNLFGLEEKVVDIKETETIAPIVQKEKNYDWLGLTDSKPATPKLIETKPPVTIENIITRPKDFGTPKLHEDDDLLDQLGLSDSLKNTKIKSAKDSLDFLGKPYEEPPSLVKKNEKPAPYTPSISTSKTIPDSEPKKTIISKLNTGNYEKKDVPRRQKDRKDWLGLLDDEPDDIFEEKKSSAKKPLSEFLNSSESKKDVPELRVEKTKQDSKIEKEVEPVKIPNYEYKELLDNAITLPSFPDAIIPNISSNLNLEQNSATLCLQQQESHLMVALQLKAQEERLAAMHEKQAENQRVQREVVNAHREQLDSILKGQSDHRNQLQNIIKQHQQRINKHIEGLLKPQSLDTRQTDDVDDDYQNVNDRKVNVSGRNNLEHMIAILKENHEKEMDIIDSSYSRQLTILNESMRSTEERYNSEQDKLVEFYVSKINRLENENMKLADQLESTVKIMLEKHEREIERIENKHSNDIEILQKQHEIIIKNIREAYSQEQMTINETKDYSKKFNEMLADVDKNNEICFKIMEKFHSDSDVRERSMKVKEDQINRLLEHIEKQKEIDENEFHSRKNILSTIEDRLKEYTKSLDEEKSVLRNKQCEFEIEKEKFKKECDFFKSQLEFERDIFKKNCENCERNNKMDISNIEEEKRTLENEKIALADEHRLVSELKVKLNDELQKLKENRNILQQEKDQISREEANLLQKSRELEILSRTTLAKQKIAENKSFEATYAQKQYEEKLKTIQEYSLSLTSREQQIAKDKISLSRERLSLYNERTDHQFALCVMCKSTPLPKRLIELQNEPLRVQNFTNEDVLNNGTKMKNGLKDFNSLQETMNIIEDHEHLYSIKTDFVQNLPNVFHDDPKILALKLDINKYS